MKKILTLTILLLAMLMVGCNNTQVSNKPKETKLNKEEVKEVKDDKEEIEEIKEEEKTDEQKEDKPEVKENKKTSNNKSTEKKSDSNKSSTKPSAKSSSNAKTSSKTSSESSTSTTKASSKSSGGEWVTITEKDYRKEYIEYYRGRCGEYETGVRCSVCHSELGKNGLCEWYNENWRTLDPQKKNPHGAVQSYSKLVRWLPDWYIATMRYYNRVYEKNTETGAIRNVREVVGRVVDVSDETYNQDRYI